MEHKAEDQIMHDEVVEEHLSGLNVLQPVGFSLFGTMLSTLVVFIGFGLIMWSDTDLSPLEQVDSPERALEHIVDRSLNLESSMRQASEWEQYLYHVFISDEDPVDQLSEWYRELAAESQEPLPSLYAGVLEAEDGHLDQMLERMATWDLEQKPYRFFHSVLEVAYGGKTSDSEDIINLQARLAEELPDNWFYGRLAYQLAQRAGDSAFSLQVQRNTQNRMEELHWRNQVIMLAEVGTIFLGLMAIVVVVWRWHRSGEGFLVMGSALLPPPWSGHDGLAICMRGGAITLCCLLGLGGLWGGYSSFMGEPIDTKVMELLSTLILYVPIPLLLYYSILRPTGRSLRQQFGVPFHQNKLGVFSLMVLALFVCGLFGDFMVGFAGKEFGLSSHWTEWFNNSLVWGSASELTILFLEVAVLAPIFEECIFRGIVYASFRQRFDWLVSALASAVIFSVVHGYGVIGFVSVMWSGFLWAWAYEKTGSLLPGIVAHALNNFMIMVSLVVLFR